MSRRLKLYFDDPVAFRREYRGNIVQGGAFVRTADDFSLREPVVVVVELAFAGVTAELDAEVVHCVSAEHAGPDGAGVAVQFLLDAAELRDRFERYVPQLGRDGAEPSSRAGGRGASRSAAEADDDEEGGRRRRKRGRARVPAKLESSHVSLDGRTRDLSESGALLSVDGSDLPIGKRVRLTLVHPDSGESFEVEGRVARHVEAAGTVAAVAIEFDDGSDGLGPFVRDVHALEVRRRERGIGGSIGELGMGNVIQMLGKFASSGTLTATSGAEEGVLAFEGGCLRHCQLGALSGTKALARMLSWETGHFEFHAGVDALPDDQPLMPLEGAILDAARQLDEMRRADPDSLDPSARLRLDTKALASHRGPLSKTEEAVVDLAAAGLSVRRLLDVIPESDAQILEAIHSLSERGLVEILAEAE